jgi:hypothetical protein
MKEALDHDQKLCGKAYAKHKISSKWNPISVIVAGGGSRLPKLQKKFQSGPKTFVHSRCQVIATQGYEIRSRARRFRPPSLGLQKTPFWLIVLGFVTPALQMPQPVDPH